MSSTVTTRRSARGAVDAAGVGALALVAGVAGIAAPSLWYDEAATVTSVSRSWEQLATMLGTVDAVHGLYYIGIKWWLDLVGYSPAALRLPSAVAIALTAAATVLLVRRLADRRTAIAAGVVVVLIPRVAWAAIEGRSYALSTLAAVLLTALLVRAIRRVDRPRSARILAWLLYGAGALVAVLLFVYLALVVVAHAVTVVWWWAAHGGVARRHRVAVSFAVAAGSAAAAAVPFVRATASQQGQVSWLPPLSDNTARQVRVTQWFYASPVVADVFWVLAVAGVVLGVVVAVRSRRLARPISARAATPSLLQVALPWLIVPTALLLISTAAGEYLYSPRYPTFSAPAIALLVGSAIGALRWRTAIAAVLVVLAVLTIPSYLALREPEAKQSSSWPEVSALLERERAALPEGTREAVVFGPLRRHPIATTRAIALTYPDGFRGLDDVTLETPAAETGRLWEERSPVEDVADRFADQDVVWLVTSDRRDLRPRVADVLLPQGFTVTGEWHPTWVRVLRYERTPS